MKKIIQFVLVMLIMPSLSFCHAQELIQPKMVETQAGDYFTITLEANPTTGYEWQFATPIDTHKLELIKSEYVPAGATSESRYGSGGRQIWTFKALQEGKANIALKYVHPWEPDMIPEKEESFEIVIKKK